MKSSIFLLLLSVLIGLATFGQGIVTWSETAKFDEDNNDARLLEYSTGNSETLAFEVVKLNSGCAIKALLLNESGKAIKTETFKYKGGLSEIQGIYKIGNDIYFYLQEFTVKKSMFRLNAYKFNPADFTVPEVPVTLAEVSSILTGDWFQFIFDKPSGNTYVLETPPQSKKNSSDIIQWRYKGYDNNMTMLWNKEVILNLEPSRFSMTNFDVDTEGNLIVSGHYYSEPVGALRIKKYPRSKMVFCSLLKNELAVRTFWVDLKQEIPIGGGFFLENNEIICYGLYTRDSVVVANLTAGLYYAKYDISGKTLQPLYLKDFPASTVKEANLGRPLLKGETGQEILGYRIASIHPVPAGGLQFILERTNMQSFTKSLDAGNLRFEQFGMNYSFGNIIVASLYNDPAKDWFTLLPKSQFSNTARFGSFTRWYSASGTLNIFYNDHYDNQSLKPGEVPKPIGRYFDDDIVAVRARISPTGEVSKSTLFRNKDIGHCFDPMATRYIGNTAILTTSSLKTYKTGVFNIDD
jgi:hypothetical protein